MEINDVRTAIAHVGILENAAFYVTYKSVAYEAELSSISTHRTHLYADFKYGCDPSQSVGKLDLRDIDSINVRDHRRNRDNVYS